MQITERTVGEVTVLDAQGRMALNDGHGAVKQHVAELLAAGRRQLVLDLGEVPYMDSTCVGELVSLRRALSYLRRFLTIPKVPLADTICGPETARPGPLNDASHSTPLSETPASPSDQGRRQALMITAGCRGMVKSENDQQGGSRVSRIPDRPDA